MSTSGPNRPPPARPPGGPRRPGQGGPPPNQPQGLPDGYLEGGYFDEGGNLRVEVVSQWAKDVARALVGRDSRRPLIAKGQLRNFYGKAQSFKRRLDSGEPFDAIKAGVQSLERDTAAAVGRQNAPPVFKVFMDKNLPLATQDVRHFREGFVEHFQSVVGFFTFFTRS